MAFWTVLTVSLTPKQKTMKKLIAVTLIAFLASCGSGSETETVNTNDSTVIKADTTLVVDSTTVDNESMLPCRYFNSLLTAVILLKKSSFNIIINL